MAGKTVVSAPIDDVPRPIGTKIVIDRPELDALCVLLPPAGLHGRRLWGLIPTCAFLCVMSALLALCVRAATGESDDRGPAILIGVFVLLILAGVLYSLYVDLRTATCEERLCITRERIVLRVKFLGRLTQTESPRLGWQLARKVPITDSRGRVRDWRLEIGEGICFARGITPDERDWLLGEINRFLIQP